MQRAGLRLSRGCQLSNDSRKRTDLDTQAAHANDQNIHLDELTHGLHDVTREISARKRLIASFDDVLNK